MGCFVVRGLGLIATGAAAPATAATTGAPLTDLFAEDGADGQQGTYQKNGDDDSVCHNCTVGLAVAVVLRISLLRIDWGWGARLVPE